MFSRLFKLVFALVLSLSKDIPRVLEETLQQVQGERGKDK
jgi:hypothetical protein